MADVAIIDSGGANLASLLFALRRLGAEGEVTSSAQVIRSARRVLLPGVGSAGNAMQRLRAAGLDKVIPALTQPVLGICLGMQLLFSRSEEAAPGSTHTDCLGILSGTVARLAASSERPIPHMGWNRLRLRATAAPSLLEGLEPGAYFYFVHSFAAPVAAQTIASTEYGDEFTAIAGRDNFAGVQFHPERSAQAGAVLLANFLRSTKSCN